MNLAQNPLTLSEVELQLGKDFQNDTQFVILARKVGQRIIVDTINSGDTDSNDLEAQYIKIINALVSGIKDIKIINI